MLRGVLDQLDEMGNLLPRYTAPRCLLTRQTVGGCDLCQTICPHEAVQVQMGGRGIQIDPQACTGCGLCVGVCPSGALEYDLLAPLTALNDQRPQVQPQGAQDSATLTCSKSGAGGPQLHCLGRVTSALLGMSGSWDLPLTLLHGDCGGCPVGSGEVPGALARAQDAAQALRQSTGRPARITVRQATPDDQIGDVRFSRRGAFGALLRAGKKQVASQIPEQPLPFVDWSEPEQRTPEEWKWRRKSLRPAPPEDAAVFWPAPVVDSSCIDCPVCANVCPTDAIKRDLQPDGGVQLLLSLSDCTGCMGCLRSCPPGAIHEQTHWRPAALDAQILLRESDSVM